MIDITFENVRAAARAVVEPQYRTYSNALPLWFEPGVLDFDGLTNVIQARAQALGTAAGRVDAFQIALPRGGGKRQVWATPSVSDQILFQLALRSLTADLDKAIDRTRVFSFRARQDASLALVEDQETGWRDFVAAVRQRSSCEKCVLHIDLENAFGNINRARLRTFLQPYSSDGQAELIDGLLSSFAGGTPGLPVVNDATFFLGSAYLSVVDRVVMRHTTKFVRYMDDYRIFAGAEGELERLHRLIAADLRPLGFTINDRKTSLGSTEDYLDFLDRSKPASSGKYLSAVPSNIFDADVLVAQVALTLTDPERYMTDGVGRMQLASLRRLRTSPDAATPADASARAKFSQALSAEREVITRGLDLIAKYGPGGQEDWRAVWVLYLLRDASTTAMDRDLRSRFETVMRQTATGKTSPVVQLWALAASGTEPRERVSLALFSSGYLEAGRRYDGGRT